MTISTQTRTAGPFSGTGLAAPYPFAFKVFQPVDLIVYKTDSTGVQTQLALSSDYTITLNPDQNAAPGGTLNLIVPLALAYTLTFTSSIAVTQPASLTNAGGFFPRTIEDSLDRLTILMQQQAFAATGQNLRVPEIGGVPLLSPAAQRANNLLGFDASGNPVAVAPVSGSAGGLATDLTNAAAAAKGAGQIGYGIANAYARNTVGWKMNQVVYAQDKGALGDGVADDYVNLAAADAYAKSIGAVLVITRGTYAMNTSYAFTAPVWMLGGVLSGSGTVSFPAGFTAVPYYCFDCLVGAIKAETVFAEWFGARQSVATPTSTSQTTVGKAWNTWPAFIVGTDFNVKQNYGNAAFLTANTPFANADTWDFIAIQRALWSIGQVGTLRGEVRLFAGSYFLTRAVRWVGSMSSTMRGAGRTKTTIQYAAYLTHETLAVSAGNTHALLDFYVVGPDPTFVADLGLVGPNGYVFGGAIPLYLAAVQGSNGLTFENCWITVGDAGIYLDSGSNDIWIRHCTFEYGANQVYGFDAASWVQIIGCGFWWSPGSSMTGVNMPGYAFITGSTFVSLDVPFVLGLQSHVSGCTLIQRTTGYRSTVNGRTITRHLMVPIGGTVTVLTATLASYAALTSRMRVGGVVQGAGGAGLYRELFWYRDGAAPVAGVITATTKFGNVTASGLIGEGTTSGAAAFTLQVTNAGTGTQTFECDVSVTLEGSDYILSGLV